MYINQFRNKDYLSPVLKFIEKIVIYDINTRSTQHLFYNFMQPCEKLYILLIWKNYFSYDLRSFIGINQNKLNIELYYDVYYMTEIIFQYYI